MAHRRVAPLQGLVTGLVNGLVNLSPARCTGLSSICADGALSPYSQHLMRDR